MHRSPPAPTNAACIKAERKDRRKTKIPTVRGLSQCRPQTPKSHAQSPSPRKTAPHASRPKHTLPTQPNPALPSFDRLTPLGLRITVVTDNGTTVTSKSASATQLITPAASVAGLSGRQEELVRGGEGPGGVEGAAEEEGEADGGGADGGSGGDAGVE
ncbi:hypothetical protein AOQ84DRAFT_358210 [Glonium stellatum]|uniref:Uncharacterized protein n=1 Tax=Glonium stellatum TaxID=574774 RepID=A0A8E2K008_9PEZI|nr:hypothetical protein AOQ84DRAFT_358210 [Glonium stellatum]